MDVVVEEEPDSRVKYAKICFKKNTGGIIMAKRGGFPGHGNAG